MGLTLSDSAVTDSDFIWTSIGNACLCIFLLTVGVWLHVRHVCVVTCGLIPLVGMPILGDILLLDDFQSGLDRGVSLLAERLSMAWG